MPEKTIFRLIHCVKHFAGKGKYCLAAGCGNTLQAQVVQGQQRLDAVTIAKKDLFELQAVLANDHYNLVSEQNTKKQNILILKQL